jgi:hypothetical protein
MDGGNTGKAYTGVWGGVHRIIRTRIAMKEGLSKEGACHRRHGMGYLHMSKLRVSSVSPRPLTV